MAEQDMISSQDVCICLFSKTKNQYTEVKKIEIEEKGYFEFGGSTIIMLTQKDVVTVDNDLLEKSRNGIETDVEIGNIVAKKVL